FMMNQLEGGDNYSNFQLPVVIVILLICVGRSLSVLDSISVLNVENANLDKYEKIFHALIKKFYLPIFIIDIVKNSVEQISVNNHLNISFFCMIYLLMSFLKHIYEISYIGRKTDNF